MFNNCFLCGQIVEGPEITLAESGQGIALFSLAIWSGRKYSAGYVRVLCRNELAAFAKTNLEVDFWVVVTGYLFRTWIPPKGQKRSELQLVATGIEIVFRTDHSPDDIVPVG